MTDINIYDDMNNLVSNLKKTEIVEEFRKLNKEIHLEENKELFEKIQEFQAVNIQLNRMIVLKEDNTKELEEKSKQIYEELTKSELAIKYFEKEMQFTNLVSELNSIFVQEINNIYSEI